VKILVVDDDQLDLFISKKLLSLEYQVEGFISLTDMIQWVKDNSFDVLLCDYYLDKGLHADYVLKEIMKLKQKTFKAFVLSSHIDDKQSQELSAAGYDGIIEKPLSLEKFKVVVSGF
jgi:DNA-binding NtrC family response regulator